MSVCNKCGDEFEPTASQIRRRTHGQCYPCLTKNGCDKRKSATAARGNKSIRHGMHATRIYRVWTSMRQRCETKTHHAFAAYGGRGISVCERWADFNNFFADMGHPPEGMELDRFPNNDGNYEPGNVRWATVKEQAQNRRSTVLLTKSGETKCVSEWARQYHVQPRLILSRIKRGWSVALAIETKPLPPHLSRSRC